MDTTEWDQHSRNGSIKSGRPPPRHTRVVYEWLPGCGATCVELGHAAPRRAAPPVVAIRHARAPFQ